MRASNLACAFACVWLFACGSGGKQKLGPLLSGVSSRSLVDVPGPAPRRATARQTYSRPFGNVQQSSRAPVALPQGDWKIKWSRPLAEFERSAFEVELDGMAHALVGRFLFDANGNLVSIPDAGSLRDKIERARSAASVVDSGANPCSGIDGGDSRQRVALPLPRRAARLACGNGQFDNTEQLVEGDTTVVHSSSTWTHPHGSPSWQCHQIESFDLTGAPRALGILRTDRSLFLARTAERVVIAAGQYVQVADLSLRAEHTVTGTFYPRAISLDEAGRVYMIVDVDGLDDELWILSPDLERRAVYRRTGLPSVHKYRPPVVGYDHTTHIVSESDVVAVDASGRELWRSDQGGKGAAVTYDDKLLVVDDTQLVAYDRRGARRVLFEAEQMLIEGPPLLASDGTLYIVSRDVESTVSLVALTVEPPSSAVVRRGSFKSH